MKNREIAEMLDLIADMLELTGDNVFKVNSYRKVSRIVGDLTEDIAALAAEGTLTDLPGVGQSMAQHIQEYLATGTMARYEELAANA